MVLELNSEMESFAFILTGEEYVQQKFALLLWTVCNYLLKPTLYVYMYVAYFIKIEISVLL